MKKVFQNEREDCLRACVASILELPLLEVPDFIKSRGIHEEYNEDWWEDLVDFLAARGYNSYWTENGSDFTGEYSIGYGRIEDMPGWEHVVVCWNDKIVHDPSGEWLLEKIDSYINFQKKMKERGLNEGKFGVW